MRVRSWHRTQRLTKGIQGMITSRQITTLFVAGAVLFSPVAAAHAATNVSPSDVVVPGGTNAQEIIVTIENSNLGLDGASIRLTGATWTTTTNPSYNTVSTNATTFTDCGSSGVSVKTTTATTGYKCDVLGTDAIIKSPDTNASALGATTTFRIAPGAIAFASSGTYAITAIVSGFNGVAAGTSILQLTQSASPSPAPTPNPNPTPTPTPSPQANAAATLARTGTSSGLMAPIGLALVLLVAGGATLVLWRQRAL